MVAIERHIFGKRALKEALERARPLALLRLTSAVREDDSKRLITASDPNISSYLNYVSGIPFDSLPTDDQALVSQLVRGRAYAQLMELDLRIGLGEPKSTIANVCNHEYLPTLDVWFSGGIQGYGDLRQNYSTIDRLRRRGGWEPLFRRIELYQTQRVIDAGPDQRFFLLLRWWEECMVNRCKLTVIDIERVPTVQRPEFQKQDFHLLEIDSSESRLWKLRNFMGFDSETGQSSVRTVRDHEDILAELERPAVGRRIERIEDLQSLCVEWNAPELRDDLKRWESLRQQRVDDPVAEILARIFERPNLMLDAPPNGRRRLSIAPSTENRCAHDEIAAKLPSAEPSAPFLARLADPLRLFEEVAEELAGDADAPAMVREVSRHWRDSFAAKLPKHGRAYRYGAAFCVLMRKSFPIENQEWRGEDANFSRREAHFVQGAAFLKRWPRLSGALNPNGVAPETLARDYRGARLAMRPAEATHARAAPHGFVELRDVNQSHRHRSN